MNSCGRTVWRVEFWQQRSVEFNAALENWHAELARSPGFIISRLNNIRFFAVEQTTIMFEKRYIGLIAGDALEVMFVIIRERNRADKSLNAGGQLSSTSR